MWIFGKSKKHTLIDLAILELLVIFFTTLVFPGIPKFASWEGSPIMNLPRVKIIAESLPNIPGWNPYWYFGSPILRFYPPLFYYTMAFVTWISNLGILDAFMLYTYIVFSIGILSIYLFGKEANLSRLGSFTSALLFLTSSNIWVYWDAGSTENILAVLLAIPSLLLLFKALRKPTILNIIFAGVMISTTYLTHLSNAYIFTIIIGGVCFAFLAVERSIIFFKRIFRVMVPCVLIVLGLSLFWYLPFFYQGGLTKFLELGLIPTSGSPVGASIFTQTQEFLSQIYHVIGFDFARNLWSPGFGHFFLALAGCILSFKNKEKVSTITAGLFIFTLIGCFSPWLYLPLSLPYRFAPYYSIFAALCGGYALEKIGYQYLIITREAQIAVLFSGILVIATVYPSVDAVSKLYFNRNLETSEPDEITWLKDHSTLGEWVATNDLFHEWRINIYTPIGQAGGTDLYARTNLFAHTFWYYVLSQQDSRYLAYLSRNFNVKHLLFQRTPNMSGIQNVYKKIYEVEGFNSSFVEILSPDSLTVLFFGDEVEYTRLFESIAPMNSSDIILINGGEHAEDYSIEEIRQFDVIYLDGLRYNNLTVFSELLSDFVEEGGGIILDIGNFPFGGNMEGVPDPFPVSETKFTPLTFILNQTFPNNITADIDFTRFSNGTYHASSAGVLKTGSENFVSDDGRPVLVYWKYGMGRVIWSGLRLPYHTQLYKNFEEMKLLENMIKNVTLNIGEKSQASVTFEFPNVDEIVINVYNAESEDVIWAKMSYYPGWIAYLNEEELPIFLGGPNMMIVSPRVEGDYTIRFKFEKTFDVQIGEYITIISLSIICFIVVYIFVKDWRRKKKLDKQKPLWSS